MEPAVFGIPVIIGPKYDGFKEAEDLVALKGDLPITNTTEFTVLTDQLLADQNFKRRTGNINSAYIFKNKGASEVILKQLKTYLD